MQWLLESGWLSLDLITLSYELTNGSKEYCIMNV